MFHDYFAIKTVFPGHSTFPYHIFFWVFMVAAFAAFFYDLAASRRRGESEFMQVVVAVSTLLWLIMGGMIVMIGKSGNDLAVTSLERAVEARIATGACTKLREQDKLYTVVGLNSLNHTISLQPELAQDGCQDSNARPGVITMQSHNLELISLMARHVLQTSKPFDGVLAAALVPPPASLTTRTR